MLPIIRRTRIVPRNLFAKPFSALPPPTPPSQPIITASTSSTPTPTQALNWEQYLQKRRSKKWLENICAIPTTFAGLSVGVSYFANVELDPTASIAGFEPIYVYFAATIASAFGGFLLGTPLGGLIWRVYNRRFGKAIEGMDKKFFDHIAKHRADPSLQSVNAANHPIPDYYGEKIFSLSGYRKWLRAQSKYKKKAHIDQAI